MPKQKGSGCLYKKGKFYMAKWVVNGVPYVRSTKETQKDKALIKLKEFTLPFQSNSDIDKIENLQAKIRSEENKIQNINDEFVTIELKDIFNKYTQLANSPNLSLSTKRTYEGFVTRLVKYNDTLNRKAKIISDIDVRYCEAFLSYLKSKNFSAQCYNSQVAFYKKIWEEFGKISQHRYFRNNPWSKFKYQSQEVSYKRELTLEELSRILNYVKNDEELSLLFTIGIYAGLRLSDCCSLKWCEVDLIKNVITKIPKKTMRTGKKVIIPIHPFLQNKLIYHKQLLEKKIHYNEIKFDEEKEFVSYHLYRTTEGIHAKINRIFKAVGIKNREYINGRWKTIASFHSLRHTFVSMAASSGVHLNVIQNLVGHNSVKMTEHYTHISNNTLNNAINQLPIIDESLIQKVNKVVNVEIEEDIINELKKITSKTISEILKDYIIKNSSNDEIEVI